MIKPAHNANTAHGPYAMRPVLQRGDISKNISAGPSERPAVIHKTPACQPSRALRHNATAGISARLLAAASCSGAAFDSNGIRNAQYGSNQMLSSMRLTRGVAAMA